MFFTPCRTVQRTARTHRRFNLLFAATALLLLATQAAQAALPVAKLTVTPPVVAGRTLSATLLATDADGDPLTYELVTQPAQGGVVIDDAATGAFTYTANADANRRDTFTFRVSDAEGFSNVATVYLTVHPRGNRVVGTGSNWNGELNVDGWHNVVAITTGERSNSTYANRSFPSVGITASGTLAIAGWSAEPVPCCEVVDAAADWRLAALKSDGTVMTGEWSGDPYGLGSWSGIVAIDNGIYHTLGLRADGSVVCGVRPDANSGQCDVGGWSEVIAVVARGSFSLGLKADGTVVATGYTPGGLPNVGGWTNIVAIAAGDYHAVGLKADGTVVAAGCGGSYNWTQCNTAGLNGVVAITAGPTNTIGLKSDGALVEVGAVGGPDQRNLSVLNGALAIAAGWTHAIGLMPNHAPVAAAATLYAGVGLSVTARLADFGSDVDQDTLTATAADGAHGTVASNGDGTFTYTPADGFSGDDTFTYSVSDYYETRSGTITVHVVSATHSTPGDGIGDLWRVANGFVDGLGNLKITGAYAADGDLDGDGITNIAEYQAGSLPTNRAPASQLRVVRPVVAGMPVSGALASTDVEGNSPTYAVTTQPLHGTVALNATTGAFTYSADAGANGRDSFSYTATDIGGTSTEQTVHLTILPRGNRVVDTVGHTVGWGNVVQTAAGHLHSVGLKADGSVVGGGSNGNGQIDVGSWSEIAAIAGGCYHTVGLTRSGGVMATGLNDQGQSGVSAWTEGVVAVAAGCYHTVALKADGTVVAVGCGAGTEVGQCNVSTWSNVVAIAAGPQHTVGLTAAGTVLATGLNNAGQTDLSAWTDPIVAVAAGNLFTAGLTAQGRVVLAGYTGGGQSNATGWTDVVAIAAGDAHIVGLTGSGSVLAAGDNTYGQTEVSTWTGMVGVGAGVYHTLGLKTNQLPTAANAALTTGIGTAASSVNLPALASDADADTLTITAVSTAAHGTVTDNGNGTVAYTPTAGYSGNDSFTYTLSDGVTGTATATVTVHVVSATHSTPGDGIPDLWRVANGFVDAYGNLVTTGDGAAAADPNGDGYSNLEAYTLGIDPNTTLIPLANADGYDLLFGQTLTVAAASGLIANDAYAATDATTSGLTVTLLSGATHGDLTLAENGSFTYTATDPSAGSDTFTYRLWNGHSAAEATVTLTIAAGAKTTVMRPVVAGRSVTGQLLAAGRTGYALTWELVSAPAKGSVTLTDAATGTFTYAAGAAESGHDRFTFRVSDDGGPSAVATVALTVQPRAHAVQSAGYDSYGVRNVGGWRDIVAVAGGDGHTLGVKADGTVVATGRTTEGQTDVAGWSGIVAAAAGVYHSIGLQSDGTVVALGDGGFGRTDVAAWSDVVAVVAEMERSMGLKADGTVVAVGADRYGENLVSDWRNVIGLAAGDHHTVGLKADGSVVATGSNTAGQINVTGWSNIVAVAAGAAHTVGLKADGTVVAVGGNSSGQLGVSAWSGIVAVAAGDYHTLGLKADGTVVGAGQNVYGQVNVAAWSGIRSLESGANHSLGLQVKPWPVAADRTFYIEQDAAVTTPDLLALASGGVGETLSLSAFTQPGHAVVTADGAIFTYTPAAGFTGDDSFTYTVSDGIYADVGTVTVHVVSADHSTPGDGISDLWRVQHGFVDGQGNLLTTGAYGASGNPDGDLYTNLEEFQAGTDPNDAASGFNLPPEAKLVVVRPLLAGQAVGGVARAVDREGDPVTFTVVAQPAQGQVALDEVTGAFTYTADAVAQGRDTFTFRVSDAQGRTSTAKVFLTIRPYGRSTGHRVVEANGPGNVSGWRNIVAIAAGYDHTVGVKADGTVVTNAANYVGEGDVGGWTEVVEAAAGYYFTLGLKADGSVVGAGGYGLGETSVGGWSNIVAIAVGSSHSVGLKADGTVVAVGYGSDGQLAVAGWRDIVAIDAGDFYTAGLKSDGTVVTAGVTDFSTAALHDIVALAAGPYHLVGLKADGSAVAVGANWSGESDVGTWRDLIAVAAGEGWTLGVKADGSVAMAGYLSVDTAVWNNLVGAAGGPAISALMVGLKANRVPSAIDAALYTEPGVAISTGNLLAQASDGDSDTLTIDAFTQGTHGTVTGAGNGIFSYTPDAGFSGNDSFTYTIIDGFDGSATGTVTITVSVSGDTDGDGMPNPFEVANGLNPNDAADALGDLDGDGLTNVMEYLAGTNISAKTPDVLADEYAAKVGGTLNVDALSGVLANDSDVSGNALTVQLVSGPSHAASFALNADGSFSYVQDGSLNVSDSFDYRVSNGLDVSLTATATLSIPRSGALKVLSLSPSSARLPEAGGSASFTLSNVSATAVDITTASLSGSGYSLGPDSCSGVQLAAGASCTVQVDFAGSTSASPAVLEIARSGSSEVLSAFLTNREAVEEEARRRLPATLLSLSGLPATLTAGTTYTITWTMLSYDPSLKTMLVVFDCGAATDCGASYGEASRIATSGYLSSSLVEAGSWSYNGQGSTQLSYSYSFTPSTAGNLVLRLYQKSAADEAAGKGGISSLIPGGLGEQYVGSDGRRLLRQVQ